jgi:hypothetical protein
LKHNFSEAQQSMNFSGPECFLTGISPSSGEIPESTRLDWKFSGATGTLAPTPVNTHISTKEGEIWALSVRDQETPAHDQERRSVKEA